MKNGFKPSQFIRRQQIGLIQNDHIAELDLLNQQIDHRAFIFITQTFATISDVILRTVVTQKIEGIDHGDHGVEAGNIGKTAAVVVAKSEGFSYR